METIFSAFWFFLPAGIANMVPVLFKWIPFDTPIDFGKKLGGKPIFGETKTYRGFLLGAIFATLTVYIQSLIYPSPYGYTLVNYGTVNILCLGFLMGFGALLGDLVESFFKRRLNMPSGWLWAPFDQLDWILGAVVLTGFYVSIEGKYKIVALIIFGLLHPVVNLIGYALHVKKNKF
jgi:CDP-2,3-bis-(O-geranylgeranyl)-sn-glycerol synthase